jgi:PAS domain S-box-containing protein
MFFRSGEAKHGGRVTQFEARAIENIATAPATSHDRRFAGITALAFLALLLGSIPISSARWAQLPALVPTVVGAGIVVLVLTTVLFYVQYRSARDLKLALLALAYAYATAWQGVYLLTFPNAFVAGVALGAAPQTAAWCYVVGNTGFALLLALEGIAAQRGWQLSRRRVRALALALAGLVALAAIALVRGAGALPALTVGNQYQPLWTLVVGPAMALTTIVAMALVAMRLRTVTEVWLGVILLSRCIAIISASELGSARYSVGWYAARFEELLGTVLMLAVFLVKVNDLVLRLAARGRTTAEALAAGQARYISLTNVVPQLIWTANAQGEVEYVNDRWVAYTGLPLDAARGGGWRTAIDPAQEPLTREQWSRSVRSGEPFAAELRLRELGGRARWFLVNAVPVRGAEGTVVAWICTSTDVDAQKRLEEREAFLARAGERLGASLDVVATVGAIKTLLVPRIAERAWVALRDDDGRYVLSGLGSVDLADEMAARRWLGTPMLPALADTVERVVAGIDPVVVDEPRFEDPWLRDAAAAMIVPLIGALGALGVLALTREGPPPFDSDDLSVVREFARRAALSLEHARLYERERTTADALQRAMLPAQLPLLPDIHFSASYSAASESQRVGGDFYDAFAIPDGRVAVTIGDVTGHGLEAAVIMGEIRQALRAAAFEAAEPSAILDRASQLLVASGRTVFVTAIFGLLDPATGRFAYASAGHPAPLLNEGAQVRRLPTAGLPLGLRDDEGVDFALYLHAPCTLVMFTDGLMEFARDLDEGERRIEAALRALAPEHLDHLAGALMKEVLGEDEPSDDIAILTVTVDRLAAPLDGDERAWSFSSGDGRTSTAVRRDIGALVAEWSARPETQFASELAFGELIANAVRHAPGPVRVIVQRNGHAVRLIVEDRGEGFVPRAAADRLDAESGRGLMLVRAIADGLAIEATPLGGTRVVVTFAVPAPSSAAS